jgi:hypothetical protein
MQCLDEGDAFGRVNDTIGAAPGEHQGGKHRHNDEFERFFHNFSMDDDFTPCFDKDKKISTIYFLAAVGAQRANGALTGDAASRKHILCLSPNSLWS